MGLRRKSRELALQFLFGYDMQQLPAEDAAVVRAIDNFILCFETGAKALDYTRELVTGILGQLELIDGFISTHSHNWRLERMSLVDRNLLRIAVYEMQYRSDVPAEVAINEALEIAKRYSAPDSVSFINGILDALHKGRQATDRKSSQET
jgi:N utilization substance protein B